MTQDANELVSIHDALRCYFQYEFAIRHASMASLMLFFVTTFLKEAKKTHFYDTFSTPEVCAKVRQIYHTA